MRKIIFKLLSFSLCFAMLAGCGGKGEASSKAPEKEEVKVEADDGKTSIPEIVPEGNTALYFDAQTSKYDKEADARRNEILNTKDEKLGSAKVYYVSPSGDDKNDGTSPKKAWKTPNAINKSSWMFKSGDTVLFERGGIYRTTSAILVKSGMSYGAYGEGDKPVIYGSVKNYTEPNSWKPSKKANVWKLDFSLEDVGIIVFDHGKAVGDKKTGLKSLTENGDFYHNLEDKILYVYLDKGRPNQVYSDIEIGTKRAVFSLSRGVSNVTIDNICMKYAGTFGVQCIGENNKVTVKNCEIGWIGGSTLTGTTRYGNGIQFWDSCQDAVVTNNWIYQIYDTGITFQGSKGSVYKNIKFADNLIEYTAYALEFFIDGDAYVPKSDGTVKDIYFENNILRFGGYGWTAQRPNMMDVGLLVAWTHTYEDMSNFNITGNVFDCSANDLVYWQAAENRPQGGLNISGNSFYQSANSEKRGMRFGNSGLVNISDQKSLEAAVAYFDKAPATVEWIG